MNRIYYRKTTLQKIGIILITGGTAAAIIGRHSVLGLSLGFGMLFIGWAIEEVTS